MFNPNTPFHMIYSSMTCPCRQCHKDRNAETAIIPRLEMTTRNEQNTETLLMPRLELPTQFDKPVVWKAVTGIDSETGKRVTSYWPYYPRS